MTTAAFRSFADWYLAAGAAASALSLIGGFLWAATDPLAMRAWRDSFKRPVSHPEHRSQPAARAPDALGPVSPTKR